MSVAPTLSARHEHPDRIGRVAEVRGWLSQAPLTALSYGAASVAGRCAREPLLQTPSQTARLSCSRLMSGTLLARRRDADLDHAARKEDVRVEFRSAFRVGCTSGPSRVSWVPGFRTVTVLKCSFPPLAACVCRKCVRGASFNASSRQGRFARSPGGHR